MTHFLDKILGELKNNSKLNSNSLVRMLTESTDKSIALGENPHAIYLNLKKGLYSINEQVSLTPLKVLIGNIEKSETTPEMRVSKIASEVNLRGKISKLKKSISYTNPIIKTNFSTSICFLIFFII